VTDDPLPPGEIAPAHCRDLLLPALRRDTTPAADIVAATEQLMVTNAHDLPDVPRWHTDHTLIPTNGSAARGWPPTSPPAPN
jgi:hypothetical protein